MLDEEAIEEFMKIYRQVFGLEIDFQTASGLAHRLVRLVQTVYFPEL